MEQKDNIIPSIPALFEKESCDVCYEEFSQEFKHDEIGYLGYMRFGIGTPYEQQDDLDDSDQWHLINAIRPDGPNSAAYHPQCYSDKGKNLDKQN